MEIHEIYDMFYRSQCTLSNKSVVCLKGKTTPEYVVCLDDDGKLVYSYNYISAFDFSEKGNVHRHLILEAVLKEADKFSYEIYDTEIKNTEVVYQKTVYEIPNINTLDMVKVESVSRNFKTTETFKEDMITSYMSMFNEKERDEMKHQAILEHFLKNDDTTRLILEVIEKVLIGDEHD